MAFGKMLEHGLSPELTGQQGYGTPEGLQNATIQGLGGSMPPTGQQSPAEKLLQYSRAFPTPQVPATAESVASQLFPPSGSGPANPKAGLYKQGMENEFDQKQAGGLGAPGSVGGLGAGTPGGTVAETTSGAVAPGVPQGTSLTDLKNWYAADPAQGKPGFGQWLKQYGIDPAAYGVQAEIDQKSSGQAAPGGAGALGAGTSGEAIAQQLFPGAPPALVAQPQPGAIGPPDGSKKLQPGLPGGEAWVNPVPKPSDPNDLEGMAAYYRGFAQDPLKGDPSYANITGADVGNQRMLALTGKFAEMGHPEWNDIGAWVRAGKPGGQWTPAGNTTPGAGNEQPGGTGGTGGAPPAASPNGMPPGTTIDDLKGWYAADPAQNKPAFADWLKQYGIDPKAFGVNTPAPAPATPPPGSGTTMPPVDSSPPGGVNGPPSVDTRKAGTILDEFNTPLGGGPTNLPPIAAPDVSNDPWTQQLMQAIDKYKDSADGQIRRAVTSSAAATGRLNMGGFGGSVAKEIGNYNAGLDKEAAGTLATAHQSALDRALQAQIAERAQRTQLELGRMDVMTKKYTSDQALEGERYRAQIDQAIAESQGKVQKEISAAVNEKDISIARLNADTAAKVAAQNAAAASAGAGASVAAQHYAADMAYKETLAKIAQQREEAQLQYNLGLTQVGANVYGKQLDNQQATLQFLQGLGPEQLAKYLFGNQQVPSPVYVQP